MPYENEYVPDDEIEKNGHCMEDVMAFVNEFVSEEDIRKYDLDSLWARYHGKNWRVTGFRHAWTVDRARKIWFIPVVSGREEFSNRKTCVLHLGDELFEITVELAAGSTAKLDAVPFRRIWKLLTIKPDGGSRLNKQEIVSALKQALQAYGYRGAHSQVPNTVVEFEF